MYWNSLFLTWILYSVIMIKVIRIRRFRRCVEAHVSRLTVWTDKAGGWTAKGAHAEERYSLMDILSGCIVKSYMSVTERR